jgi:argininosuccinate lyase
MDVCLYMSQNFDFISYLHILQRVRAYASQEKPDVFELIRVNATKFKPCHTKSPSITNNQVVTTGTYSY